MSKGIKGTKRTHDRAPDAEPATPYLDLACEAVLEEMTCEQVIAQLVSRIKRDQGYLAYRKASGRKTRYDEQVTSDLRAIALAICWLHEADAKRPLPSPERSQSSRSIHAPRGTICTTVTPKDKCMPAPD